MKHLSKHRILAAIVAIGIITSISCSTGNGEFRVTNSNEKKAEKKTVCITFTTTKKIGEEIKLKISAHIDDEADIWIDLNNNKKKDEGEGEEIVTIYDNTYFTIESQTITIYGKIDYLLCRDLQLTDLDVSSNTALKSLYCAGNNLENIDVSNNTSLEHFDCSHNKLTSLDVSSNTALKSLYCTGNQITNLNVNNKALQRLMCNFNKLTNLDVSNNISLEYLCCNNNQLTSLDVVHNKALTDLSCGTNQLTSLDVSHNKALTILTCSINKLTSLDVSSNTLLKSLGCHKNPSLVKINVANGNNANFERNMGYCFYAIDCPNLKCIKIDKGFTPNNDWEKPESAVWKNDGTECP